MTSDAPLSLAARLAGVVAAAGLAFLASPGVTGRDGSLFLAVLAVALWSATVVRPLGERPGRARLVEWSGGALVGGLMMWWVKYVVLFGVLYIAAGWGVYFVAMGALLRRLARRFAFPLAVALSWTGVELVRALVPPPFGLGWFRLGYYTHAQVWLSGAARVLGVEGLTFVVAALGGLAAALWTERRLRRPAAIAGLAPLFLAALAALVVPAPETREGPRVLLVQPGFTQRRKQFDDARANIAFSRDLTHRAAREVGPVDLVCWGESMLYCQLFSKRAEAAIRAGTARGTEWGESCTAAELDQWQDSERTLVQREILALGDPARPFAEGTAFAVGAELLDLVDGRLRRKVALAFFDSAGQPAEPALKRFLVPLGETFFGLERFAWVRSLARSAAGYLPDLLPGDETGRFELRTRDGRTFRMSGTICFDNAHPWPYLDAVRSDPVDFHLVTSNEAWYETSCEMDQMLAFSRVFALMTGRAIVRATNSGVSAVLGPDGAEIGRVRDAGGRDRAVAGFGAWIVPVPRAEHSGAPPYASWSRTSEGLWIALLVLAALVARPR